jgi:hypothetical protein
MQELDEFFNAVSSAMSKRVLNWSSAQFVRVWQLSTRVKEIPQNSSEQQLLQLEHELSIRGMKMDDLARADYTLLRALLENPVTPLALFESIVRTISTLDLAALSEARGHCTRLLSGCVIKLARIEHAQSELKLLSANELEQSLAMSAAGSCLRSYVEMFMQSNRTDQLESVMLALGETKSAEVGAMLCYALDEASEAACSEVLLHWIGVLGDTLNVWTLSHEHALFERLSQRHAEFAAMRGENCWF